MAADVDNSFLTEKASDYAKLSRLAYADWIKVGNTWTLPEGSEYWGTWNEMKTKYSVRDFYPNDSTGFSATVFTKDGTDILAIRGSEDPLDYVADAQLATHQMPSGQFESLIQFIQQEGLTQTFDVTGHSLGGYLAQVVKAVYPESVGDVYTYNAPGAKSVWPLYTLIAPIPFTDKVIVAGIDPKTMLPRTFTWNQSTWDEYQVFLANKDVTYDAVYNISGKDGLSVTAITGTDIGQEVFVANSSHSIATLIDDLKKNQYYIDPRKPVSFIGSSANERIDGNYNSTHYSNNPIQNLDIEGGYGNDVLYGDLDDAINQDQTAKQKTGNTTGVPGNDWLYGGAGNDSLYGGGGGDSRAMPLPRIRSEIARTLSKELGLSRSEIARQLGVSHVAVLKMMKKESVS